MREPVNWLNRPFAELVRLAWPIMVSMLSYSTMTVVDTLFVSRIGASALAGVGLGGITLFTLLCFSLGLLRGIKVLVSQAVGANRAGEVGAYLSAGVAVGLALSVLTMTLGALVLPFLHHLAASIAAGEHAVLYMGVRVLGTPALFCFVALREYRYGQGDARAPMVASVIGNMSNIALDYVFVVLCGWGVAGVAWASVVANVAEAGVLIAIRYRDVLALSRPAWSHMSAICRMGVPMGGQFLLEIGSFTLLTMMISAMSESEMAAHQLVLHVLHFAFLPGNAIAEAGSVLAGQAVGAERDDLVVGVAGRAQALAGAYAGLCTVACVFFAPNIIAWFTSEAELAHVAHNLMYIAALFLLVDSGNMVARGVLRGVGDVRYAAVVGIASAWLLTPPLTWLLGYRFELGASGGWLGLCAEIIACTGILWWRLLTARWLSAASRSRASLLDPASSPIDSEAAAVTG